ncbi:hypothetical protein CHCC20490_0383 [Bacillus paralicheniformis]|nr:hypothetical protein CHCC5023_2697 [Bacillus paralicheniformis]TWJ73310.1 hypothetical protein CHCC5019_0555 [Bacillus paralicheniformis]TWN90901.1 hypothetical protein CHCC20490_0383 [Bacillus paralicheniformis]
MLASLPSNCPVVTLLQTAGRFHAENTKISRNIWLHTNKKSFLSRSEKAFFSFLPLSYIEI